MGGANGLEMAKTIVAMAFGAGLIVNALLFLPQIRSILRTKSARGVSLVTFTGFTAMQAIGLLHGIMQGDWSLMPNFMSSALPGKFW